MPSVSVGWVADHEAPAEFHVEPASMAYMTVAAVVARLIACNVGSLVMWSVLL